jgi:hypothetical protein
MALIPRALRLIREGADLDCVDAATGMTSLMGCTSEACDCVAELLIAAGAKLA